ncbi:hypothetical protein A4G28_23625 [Mycobacterium ostraviense]|uniref:Uncharacterized protein n=1 Tax=Mycobacterium ostraviense TaxID=2738409 RepID=A0A164EZ68_9MYCO|nr:hypothetical protein A4G28_23625 [Mycobacterium ostraviense]
MKTFHGGITGWRDEQLPDGVVIWTSPTGKTYRTVPAGAELFSNPAPRRSRTRADERAARIARARNRNHVQRRVNTAEQELRQVRKAGIEARKFRNRMRDMLFLFRANRAPARFAPG